MLYYVLICLSLALTGVAGLQFTYLFYLDRLDKERKNRLLEVERRCRDLTLRLEDAERRIEEQDLLIDELYAEDEETWADVIDEG